MIDSDQRVFVFSFFFRKGVKLQEPGEAFSGMKRSFAKLSQE